MADDPTDREPIVSEGPFAIVDASDDEPAAYRLVSRATDPADAAERRPGIPIDDTEIDDLAAVVSRLRGLKTDVAESPEPAELTCHECGTAWTYTGSDEHASCPNCETEVPVEGIGP
ncbi:hypothetical protein [Natrinema salaciae]|uniref:Uncharacterized protein n=1 Tax=Natrinema salaciae TaxID=1186196 RepID=A0A1H9G8G1_9EURY|nr:hypothetical protein [Natrinema salaciae]SEQ46391.1 hypothetical protein SAMN04489841_1811 [Natrinema salaciae]